jgi:hypothetical protein
MQACKAALICDAVSFFGFSQIINGAKKLYCVARRPSSGDEPHLPKTTVIMQKTRMD